MIGLDTSAKEVGPSLSLPTELTAGEAGDPHSTGRSTKLALLSAGIASNLGGSNPSLWLVTFAKALLDNVYFSGIRLLVDAVTQELKGMRCLTSP